MLPGVGALLAAAECHARRAIKQSPGIESVSRRLTAVVRTGSSLPQFFKDLTTAVTCMHQERHHALLAATDKVSVSQPEDLVRECLPEC